MQGTFNIADEIRKAQAFLKKIEPLIHQIHYSLSLQNFPYNITKEAFDGIERYRYFRELDLGVNHPERLFNNEFSGRRSAIYEKLKELAHKIVESNYTIKFDLWDNCYIATYQEGKINLDQNDQIILQEIKGLMQSVINIVQEFSIAAY